MEKKETKREYGKIDIEIWNEKLTKSNNFLYSIKISYYRLNREKILKSARDKYHNRRDKKGAIILLILLKVLYC